MEIEHEEEKIGCATDNSTCCKRAEVPSDEEVEALSGMREIKARVKELKKRLSEIASSNGKYLTEKSKLEKEITELKSEWNELEQKREKAARDRMILLGHERT